MFLALAHFHSKHPMVPPLSHRVVRKLVLAWKSQFHTFSRTFVVCLPCASCDLYISLLQRHLLECDDHYALSWNAITTYIVQDVSKWLLWGGSVRTHTISRYLELWHPKRPASSALYQWQGLVPAHEPAQSLPLPIMCHGDHCTSWDKCIRVQFNVFMYYIFIFLVDSDFWMECVW